MTTVGQESVQFLSGFLPCRESVNRRGSIAAAVGPLRHFTRR